MTGITIQDALDNRNSKSDTKNDTQMSLGYLNKEDTTVVSKPPVTTTKPPAATTKPPVVSNPTANITHILRPYAICSSYWEQQSNVILNTYVFYATVGQLFRDDSCRTVCMSIRVKVSTKSILQQHIG